MTRRARVLIGLVATACSLAPVQAIGEEQAQVYESLADVKIGRIFLSPEQRSRLDQRRGKAPVASAARVPVARGRVSRSSPDAAGYILRSGGPTRVWSNGNFVPADDASGVTFPGDVEVLRKAEPGQETTPGAADDDS